ncbi:hypothetical protein [Alteromonas stellipolaris]|uniref:hypothetical protein n=1 Tax=Alteromonas stellipolaris TaxID=233316 RepID=UPI0026E22A24|nr:hypothetical protein [Alteromonas stellipolaris]MDO6536041.1 hypothetical protein [Alteromonas stellipolaris]MDO6627949.1 hypothetical protein [Alteromonas stellipolaris]
MNKNCIESDVIDLIKKLRNSVDVSSNFSAFDDLVKSNIQFVVGNFNTKWLVSICDTYADFGNSEEKRNALYITWFVATLRLADTVMLMHNSQLDTVQVTKLKTSRVPLYDGLKTLHLDRQDTLLNLSKRTHRNMQTTPFLLDIFVAVTKRMKSSNHILLSFMEVTKRPSFVFPEAPLELYDNHGVKE